jgi:hypothetical protein
MSKSPYINRLPKFTEAVHYYGLLSPRRFAQWQVDQLEEIASAIRNGVISEKDSYPYCDQVKAGTYRGIA